MTDTLDAALNTLSRFASEPLHAEPQTAAAWAIARLPQIEQRFANHLVLVSGAARDSMSPERHMIGQRRLT